MIEDWQVFEAIRDIAWIVGLQNISLGDAVTITPPEWLIEDDKDKIFSSSDPLEIYLYCQKIRSTAIKRVSEALSGQEEGDP